MDRHRLYLCFGGLPRPLLSSRSSTHLLYTKKMYTWNGSDCLVKKQAFGGDLKSCKFYIFLASTPSSTAGNCFVIIFIPINIKKRNACFCVCIDFYLKQNVDLPGLRCLLSKSFEFASNLAVFVFRRHIVQRHEPL